MGRARAFPFYHGLPDKLFPALGKRVGQVEPFAEFLDRTANARPEQYAEAMHAAAERSGLSSERSIEEFERMKRYILSYYEGVTPVHSFLTSAGQAVDCVPFEQQPSLRVARAAGFPTDSSAPPPLPVLGISLPHNAAPQSAPVSGTSLPPGAPSSSPPPSALPGARPSLIPPGTVPLLRISLDRLIPMGTLDSFFRKSVGHPASDQGSSPVG